MITRKSNRNSIKVLRSQREKRIRTLEAELACTRKMIEKNKTTCLDEAQLTKFLDELTERIEWATNRIVDETAPKQVVVQPAKTTNTDGFSWLLKCSIGIPIMLFGIGLFIVLWQSANLYWAQGWNMRLVVTFLGITAFDCLCLGVEIFREKDRNYIVALFSALVSLVALIVTLVK